MKKLIAAKMRRNAIVIHPLLVIHPFLFALFPILFVYSQNLEQLSLPQIWTSVLVLLGFALGFFLLLALILRNVMKAGIMLSLLLILFFSYGYFYRLLWGGRGRSSIVEGYLVLLVVWAMIFAAGSALVLKAKRGLPDTTRVLNVMALVLVMLSVFNIAVYEFRTRTARQGGGQVKPMEIAQPRAVQPGTLPDIYYIILDGYARADVLEEVYGYDNSEFLDYLEQKGFFVADKSQANYAHTALSLAASLNLGYLDDLAARVGPESNDRQPLGEVIKDNPVFRFLKQHGYVIVAFSTDYAPTDLKNADVYLGSGRSLNALEIGLITSTPIPWLVAGRSEFDPYTPHGNRILYTLDHLADTAQLPAPHFVFAHVVGPHPPFVFDEEGNRIQPNEPFNLGDGSGFFERGGTREEYLQGYTAQLTFINGKVKAMLNDLMSQTTRPTIIILQADHGPGLLLDWDDPENTCFRERLSILNAYLLPGGGATDLYEEITPVNTFRVILNRYFGTELERLADESYYSTWDRPYQFINVTDKVRSEACARPPE
jgi:Sulfatase